MNFETDSQMAHAARRSLKPGRTALHCRRHPQQPLDGSQEQPVDAAEHVPGGALRLGG